ncbi:MAG: histidine triad nucleotide-binding protein [Thiomicrospira sp.]|uniref:histidine triad nucleotide-binding protein n=1 Tax=Thiomicrospira sp. TaxID=935 RepID=UPI001A0C3DFE|nr:histidine triad nucleotide-binding protein [Thiomicrospira sp.]MBE0493050.1 histidine triad nucleotide-binding protein [Thiomicrospira sp.]
MITEPTLFTRIINKELPAEFVYEDDKCVVIKDINPKARVHLLIIPKKPIPTLFDLKPEDKDLMGHMMLLLPQIAQSQNLDGFKTHIHTGETGGQEVFHLHIHLLGK